MVITGKTKIKTALDAHPELKDLLIEMSPKFSKLNNKLIYKTVAKWATFNDVAKIGGISICVLLHKLNEKIGTADELAKVFPECIDAINFEKEKEETVLPASYDIIDFDTRTREDYFLPELTKIIKTLSSNQAVKVISTFDPIPLKRMVESLGFKYSTEEKNSDLFETFIFSDGTKKESENIIVKKEKIPVVIQSATSIAVPVILKLLESKKLKEQIEIKELKFWDETEGHYGWIINGKADISFTSLLTSTKLFKVKQLSMPAILIWDNIKIITKGYKANSFEELKGHKIYLPLFKGAPPYIFTKYLMKLEGSNYKDFDFEFGKPFGRPEEITDNFVNGNCDTAVLCEPQVSFALHNSDNNTHISIDYGKLWKKHHPGLEKLPNAGILFKEEFVKEYPNIASLFLLELKNAIEWVKNNPKEAAKLSYKKMGATVDETEFFINNAVIEYKDATEISEQLRLYLQILKNERVLENQDIDKTMEMFKF